MLVNNWKNMYKSMAIWFPTIATSVIVYADSNNILLSEVINNFLNSYIDIEYQQYSIPIVVFITGYIGRIIKQKSMGIEENE